jgi:hypothetical protein
MQSYYDASVKLSTKLFHFNELVVKQLPRVDADWLIGHHYQPWYDTHYRPAYGIQGAALSHQLRAFVHRFLTHSISSLYTSLPDRWIAYRPSPHLTPIRYTPDEYLHTDMFPNPGVLIPCVHYFDVTHRRIPDMREFETFAAQIHRPASFSMIKLHALAADHSPLLSAHAPPLHDDLDTPLHDERTFLSVAAPSEESWFRQSAQPFRLFKTRTEAAAADSLPLLFDCINFALLADMLPYHPLIPTLEHYTGKLGTHTLTYPAAATATDAKPDLDAWLAFKLLFVADPQFDPPVQEQLTLTVPNHLGMPLPQFLHTFAARLEDWVVPELLAFLIHTLYLFGRTMRFGGQLRADHIFLFPHGTDLVPSHWELRQFVFPHQTFTLPCTAKILDVRHAYVYIGRPLHDPTHITPATKASKTFRDQLARSPIPAFQTLVREFRFVRKDYQFLLHPAVRPHLHMHTQPALLQELEDCVHDTPTPLSDDFGERLARHFLHRTQRETKPLHPDKRIHYPPWPNAVMQK